MFLATRARRWAAVIVAAILTLSAVAIVMLLSVAVLNADLYGRLTETQTLGVSRGSSTAAQSPLPTIRLVIHRILPDENSAEVSVILTLDRSLWDDFVRKGEKRLTAITRDGSSFQPFGIGTTATVDRGPVEPGLSTISVESDRFHLPTLPSMAGFPFDDIRLMPIVDLEGSSGFVYQFNFEVQKAAPGRLLHASFGKHTFAEIVLSRSWSEKALILTSSIIFFSLCLLVALTLFAPSTTLSGLEQIVAIAGFLVAAAEFRDVLGISRTSGTSALEIAIFGVPILLLAVGIAVSTTRGILQRSPSRASM